MSKSNPKRQKPVPQNSFVLVCMFETLVPEVQAQLGFLEATKVYVRRPDAFAPDREADNHIALMVYDDCIPYLQSRMRKGVTPGDALRHWQTHAESFLRCLRTHRASVFSAKREQVQQDPDTLRGALKSTYNCVFRNDAPGPVDAPPPQDAAHQFLAFDAFSKSAIARRLQAELDASTSGPLFKTSRKAPNIDAVFKEITQARAAKDMMTRDLQLQNDLLDTKARALEASNARTLEAQAAIDRLRAKYEAEALTLNAQITGQGLALKDLRGALAQAYGNNKETAAQLQWTRDELGTAMSHSHHVEQSLAERNAELAERDAEVHALRTSTSWRLTGPMRRLRRLFGKG